MKATKLVIITLVLCTLLVSCKQTPASTASNKNAEGSNNVEQIDEDGTITQKYIINERYYILESVENEAPHRFDLYDCVDNTKENLPTLPDYAELYKIVSPNEIIFKATGENSESALTNFPYLIICSKGENDPTGFERKDDKIFFDITQPVKAGTNKNCALIRLELSENSLNFIFAPAENADRAEFYAGVADIPLTTVTFDSDDDALFVHFESCQISKTVLTGIQQLEKNAFVKGCELSPSGEGILLYMQKSVSGYYISKSCFENPSVVISFEDEGTVHTSNS